MERLGERIRREFHNMGDIIRMVGDRGASDARRDILAVIRLSAPVARPCCARCDNRGSSDSRVQFARPQRRVEDLSPTLGLL